MRKAHIIVPLFLLMFSIRALACNTLQTYSSECEQPVLVKVWLSGASAHTFDFSNRLIKARDELIHQHQIRYAGFPFDSTQNWYPQCENTTCTVNINFTAESLTNAAILPAVLAKYNIQVVRKLESLPAFMGLHIVLKHGPNYSLAVVCNSPLRPYSTWKDGLAQLAKHFDYLANTSLSRLHRVAYLKELFPQCEEHLRKPAAYELTINLANAADCRLTEETPSTCFIHRGFRSLAAGTGGE